MERRYATLHQKASPNMMTPCSFAVSKKKKKLLLFFDFARHDSAMER